MAAVNEAQIREALAGIAVPGRDGDPISLRMISGLVVKDGNVGFSIEIDPAEHEVMEGLRKICEQTVHALPGVVSVTAVLTAEREAPQAAPPQPEAGGIPGIGAIIAVASGKGGVGKSTVAVNLALALAANGSRVGILDADIYGPSLPRMLGLSGGRPESADGRVLEPMRGYGVACMSMGFLIEEDTPMIWRGPMVQGALEQMLRDVAWGELDVMVVDMPPGTGDAQLTMAQRVPLAGAVIVSTPQDIALLDARKGLNMFRKVDVPVLGIVENMSYYHCPECGHRAEIFGHGGARDTAAKLDVDFLGEVPLDIEIRETSDDGRPIVVSHADSRHAQAFRDIAAKISAKLAGGAARAAPKIVVE
ncbi:MAG: iron-sulfur cluster carrier protein ApbC [Alphaproteobacteria bacterium]|nr:iron-sulfur cluster carrier protein ApbC [Alphaproteobacteria bacterium]